VDELAALVGDPAVRTWWRGISLNAGYVVALPGYGPTIAGVVFENDTDGPLEMKWTETPRPPWPQPRTVAT
jgi:hypothetical protein